MSDSIASHLPELTTAPHTPTVYEIRILDSVHELVESYRLRYEVYGALGYLRHPLVSGLEIDEHDVGAIPFGAFDLATGDMVGTIRLLSNEPQPGYEALVHRIVEDFGDARLAERVFGPPRERLPSILSEQIARQIDACNIEGFPLRELSRSITHPDHRGSGLGRGLMELGLAYAMQDGPVFLVGGCQSIHLGMYARYGYQKLPDTELNHFERLGQDANVVVCRTDKLPDPTLTHTHDLLSSIKAGALEHIRELGCGSQALFPIAAPHRGRRRTMEW
jgi:predicted GNAT family N-acyltransferase